MNFKDLLGEDGQGTRELDMWLVKNIKGGKYKDIEMTENGEIVWKYVSPAEDKFGVPHVPPLTTGDSIDPIWELAKDYAQENFDSGILYLTTDIESGLNESFLPSNNVTDWHDTEQSAIAEALFKAHKDQ